MAIYGLQTDFMNSLLKQYFGLSDVCLDRQEIYAGLGLAQEGGTLNTESFDEVFAGRPLAGYERARVVFGSPVDGTIANVNEVVFNGPVEAWATTKPVTMIGLFNTNAYEDEMGNTIKPWIVLALPQPVTIAKGEIIILAPGVIRLGLSDR